MSTYQRGIYYDVFRTKEEIVSVMGFQCQACGHLRSDSAHVEEDPCQERAVESDIRECGCIVDTFILEALRRTRPVVMPPNCGCQCHSMPGVYHVAACCSAPPVGF